MVAAAIRAAASAVRHEVFIVVLAFGDEFDLDQVAAGESLVHCPKLVFLQKLLDEPPIFTS